MSYQEGGINLDQEFDPRKFRAHPFLDITTPAGDSLYPCEDFFDHTTDAPKDQQKVSKPENI